MGKSTKKSFLVPSVVPYGKIRAKILMRTKILVEVLGRVVPTVTVNTAHCLPVLKQYVLVRQF
jgi:hypothetical protein